VHLFSRYRQIRRETPDLSRERKIPLAVRGSF